jgi:hypothetical protein
LLLAVWISNIAPLFPMDLTVFVVSSVTTWSVFTARIGTMITGLFPSSSGSSFSFSLSRVAPPDEPEPEPEDESEPDDGSDEPVSSSEPESSPGSVVLS